MLSTFFFTYDQPLFFMERESTKVSDFRSEIKNAWSQITFLAAEDYFKVKKVLLYVLVEAKKASLVAITGSEAIRSYTSAGLA